MYNDTIRWTSLKCQIASRSKSASVFNSSASTRINPRNPAPYVNNAFAPRHLHRNAPGRPCRFRLEFKRASSLRARGGASGTGAVNLAPLFRACPVHAGHDCIKEGRFTGQKSIVWLIFQSADRPLYSLLSPVAQNPSTAQEWASTNPLNPAMNYLPKSAPSPTHPPCNHGTAA